jgi:hypothetical protein
MKEKQLCWRFRLRFEFVFLSGESAAELNLEKILKDFGKLCSRKYPQYLI